MRKFAGTGFVAMLSAPVAAFAATAPQNLQQLANQVASLFNNAAIDLIVLALVIYFYGVTSTLFKGGAEKDREKLKTQLIWGVAVIFFAVSIWGIVRLLQSSIFGQNSNPTNSGTTSVQGTCNSLNCGE